MAQVPKGPPGPVERTARDIISTTGQMIAGAGRFGEVVTRPPERGLAKIAEKLSPDVSDEDLRRLTYKAMLYTPSIFYSTVGDVSKAVADVGAWISGKFAVENPQAYDKIVSAFTSAGVAFIPGIGLSRIAQVRGIMPWLAKTIGATGSATIESATDAGLTYQDALNQGKDAKQAESLATKVFMAELPMTAALDRVGVFSAAPGMTGKIARAILANAPQEAGAQMIQNIAAGRRPTHGVGEAAALGALVAAPFGVMEHITTPQKPPITAPVAVEPAKPPITPQAPAPAAITPPTAAITPPTGQVEPIPVPVMAQEAPTRPPEPIQAPPAPEIPVLAQHEAVPRPPEAPQPTPPPVFERAEPKGSWIRGEERPFAFDPNSTKKEGKFRLIPTDYIQEGTYFRRKSKTPGISYNMGKDYDGETKIQAVRFDKRVFTEEQAREWWEQNRYSQKGLDFTPTVEAEMEAQAKKEQLELVREEGGGSLTPFLDAVRRGGGLNIAKTMKFLGGAKKIGGELEEYLQPYLRKEGGYSPDEYTQQMCQSGHPAMPENDSDIFIEGLNRDIALKKTMAVGGDVTDILRRYRRGPKYAKELPRRKGYAKGIGKEVEGRGPQEGLFKEEGAGLYLRHPKKDRLEAVKGKVETPSLFPEEQLSQLPPTKIKPEKELTQEEFEAGFKAPPEEPSLFPEGRGPSRAKTVPSAQEEPTPPPGAPPPPHKTLDDYIKEIGFPKDSHVSKGLRLYHIVELFRDLEGGIAQVVKKFRGSQSVLGRAGQTGKIRLLALLGKNEDLASLVLMHEFHHVIDALYGDVPMTFARGNILGRIGSMYKWLKHDIYHDIREAEKMKADIDSIRKNVIQSIRAEATGLGLKNKERAEFIKEISKIRVAKALTEAGYISKEEIETELIPLAEWWNEGTVSHKPEELYADAMSVFTLSPEDVATRAPIFYKATRQWIQKKPEAERAMNEFWETLELGLDAGLGKLHNRLIEAKHEGDLMKAEAEAKAIETKHILSNFNLLASFFDFKLPLINQMAARGLTRSDSPYKEIAEHGHCPAAQTAYCTDIRDYVLGELAKTKNLNADILHAYLLSERVKTGNITQDEYGNVIAQVGDRSLKLNTMGLTPQSAREYQENYLKPLVGGEWNKLLEIADDFHKPHTKILELWGEGPFGSEFNKSLMAAKNWVKFEPVKYMVSLAGGNEGAVKQIYASVGYLGPIGDVVSASLEKDLNLISSLTRSIARQRFYEWGIAMGDGSVVEAKREKHGYFDKPPVNYKTVYWLWDGKVQAAHVHNDFLGMVTNDPSRIENFFNDPHLNGAPSLNTMLVPFKYAYVNLRAGFFFVNMFRDAFNTAQNLPEYKFFEPARATWGSLGFRAFGVVDAVVRTFKELPAMVRHQMGKETSKAVQQMRWMGITQSAYAQELSVIAHGAERIIRKHGVFLPNAKYENIQDKIFAMIQFAVDVVNASDMATKVATMKLLKEKHPDMSDAWIADIVNTRAGTPDTTNKGLLTPIYNWLFMYSHVAFKGWEGSWRSAKASPRTFIPKLIGNVIIPRVIAYAALEGMIGVDDEQREKTKRIMQGVPEYLLAGTIVVPLYLTDSGKSVSLTFPQDEFSRVIGGLTYYTLKNMDEKNRRNLISGVMKSVLSGLDYTQTQQPGLNPILQTLVQAGAMWKLPEGEGPRGGFGQALIPRHIREEAKYETKDWLKANKRSLQYWGTDLWNNTFGLSQFYKISEHPGEIKDTLQNITNIPVIGDILRRFVRVTSAGAPSTRAYEKKAEMEGERAIEANLLTDRLIQFKADYFKAHKEEPDTEDILKLRRKILEEPEGAELLGGIRVGGERAPRPPMTPMRFFTSYHLKTMPVGARKVDRLLRIFSSGDINIEAEVLDTLSQELTAGEMDDLIKQGREKRAISWKAIMQYRRKKALEKEKLAKPI